MKDGKLKPNCYTCKHRQPIPGDAHSACTSQGARIVAHEHGIRMGWFYYPVNFDPAWLIECDKWEEKEGLCKAE